MKRTLSVFSVVILLGVSAPALAAPIVVTAVDTVTFNFDFVAAGVVPAPPYPDGLIIDFQSTVTDAGDQGTWTVYTGLNGTGTVMVGPLGLSLDLAFFPVTFTDMSDGIFSVVLSVTAGSITVDPFAYGLGGPTGTANVTGNVFPLQQAPSAVPEPATLTLLAGGLAAAAALRRRRNRATD
jgi:hypothetical protein